MSERLTPETDALLSDQDFDSVPFDESAGQLADFARKLERERDEARAALKQIASLQRYDHDIWDDGDGQIDESEREKDDGIYLLHCQVAEIFNRVLK